jgi:hypothetical protein
MSSCKEVFNSGIIVTHQIQMRRYGLLVSCKVVAFIPLLFVVPLVAKDLQLTSTKFIFDRWMKIHVYIIFIHLVANELQTNCIGVVTIKLQYNCMELHVFLFVDGAKYNKLQLVQLVQ